MFICIQKINFISLTSFTRYCKTFQIFYFGNFRNGCPSPSKIIASIWRKISSLAACKKSTSAYFFLEMFQRNSKLVFWAIWACLAKHKMLLKIQKHYLLAKNLFHPYRFPWDNAKISQTCYLGYFENGRSRIPKVMLSIWRNCLVFVVKKLTSIATFLSLLQRYVNFLF